MVGTGLSMIRKMTTSFPRKNLKLYKTKQITFWSLNGFVLLLRFVHTKSIFLWYAVSAFKESRLWRPLGGLLLPTARRSVGGHADWPRFYRRSATGLAARGFSVVSRQLNQKIGGCQVQRPCPRAACRSPERHAGRLRLAGLIMYFSGWSVQGSKAVTVLLLLCRR